MNGAKLKYQVAVALVSAVSCLPLSSPAQQAAPRGAADAPLDLKQFLSQRESEMLLVKRRYEADRDQLAGFYTVGGGGRGGRGGGGGGGLPAPAKFGRMKKFYNEWQAAVTKIDTTKLLPAARTDKQKLLDEIKADADRLDSDYRAWAEVAPAVPFSATIMALEDGRRNMVKPDAEKVAGMVDTLPKQILDARKAIDSGSVKVSGGTARRAADAANGLRGALRNWHGFYNGYDPMFTWWIPQPYKDADKALGDYVEFLRSKAGDDSTPVSTTPVNIVADKAGKVSDVPDLNELLTYPQSEMRGVVEKYNTDFGGGGRGGRGGGARRGGGGGARGQLYDSWLAALGKLDFDAMSRPAQVDYLMIRMRIEYQRDRAAAPRTTAQDDGSRFIPFDTIIPDLIAPLPNNEKPNTTAAVNGLNGLKKQVDDAQKTAAEELKATDANRRVASAAARNVGRLQASLKDWYDRNETADSKWGETVAESYKGADQALEAYGALLRGPETPQAVTETGKRDSADFETVPPVGHDELVALLKGEMIIYTPEELIVRAQKEFAWCESEMKKASREMGFGDDWKKALERVKNDHVKEGDQPYLIRDLMREAVDYITAHKMITVPIVASETLKMEMMSPQRQLVNPFFTGGNLISVSYPTDTMTYDQKEQSMRGNNIDFARATVFHEMIPGHNFQGVNASRYNGYRRGFGTSFWGEGWACYWELLLYQEGFPKSPENKIGMLFWRMHRCARIEFSLKYHLGQWTHRQCIDFLVDRVGHERENATAEVRRSFDGSYAPLYQCGYLLGAMQLLQLHKEMVESGKMSDRAFHDAIIQGGSMPIAMVRAALTKDKLTSDFKVNWRF